MNVVMGGDSINVICTVKYSPYEPTMVLTLVNAFTYRSKVCGWPHEPLSKFCRLHHQTKESLCGLTFQQVLFRKDLPVE
uniref:Uncharacterized protein n=1 Tax=Aegilops tauschii subsp. strangulata TaxID=200361 RepID=A0A453JM56_AEGTS